MKRSERAEELFRSGMNCSQSVFCAFADEFGMDADTAAKVACGLGRARVRTWPPAGVVFAPFHLPSAGTAALKFDITRLCHFADASLPLER